MADKIQMRRDTAANWASNNPTLSAGEVGYETDTGNLKIGDGSTAWASLPYLVKRSTRTSHAFSGATSTDIAIPAGCVYCRFGTGLVTMSTTSSALLAQILTGGSTIQTVDVEELHFNSIPAMAGGFLSSDNYIGAAGQTDATKSMKGEIWSPRDSSKRTMFATIGRALTGTKEQRHRDGVASSASDTDTLRILSSAGNIAGTAYVEFYY